MRIFAEIVLWLDAAASLILLIGMNDLVRAGGLYSMGEGFGNALLVCLALMIANFVAIRGARK